MTDRISQSDKINHILVIVLGIIMSLYHISYAIRPVLSPVENQALHLSFALVLIYLSANLKKEIKPLEKVINYLLISASLFSTLYILLRFDILVNKVGMSSQLDIIVGLLLIIVILEGVRRTFGNVLTIIVLTSLLYARYGSHIGGFFYHSGYEWPRLISSVTTNLSGVFGTILEVSATFIVLFMIFGGLLDSSGAGDFFINLSLALGGRSRSGPAQAAVLSSGLVGSINGSAVANVATTGVFTIPLMKERGYSPEFAGAVESVASTGGMIMPPVMGAGAFIMAGMIGISYSQVAVAALVPAILYYMTTSVTVHLRALKIGLVPLPKEEIPNLKKVMTEGWFYLLPLISIFIFMFQGLSAMRAGFYGIMVLIIVYIIANTVKDSKFILSKEFRSFLVNGLVEGAKNTMTVAVACAAMGIVAQSVIMTGLALKVVFLIKQIAGSIPLLAVFLTMVISIFFGMGVPTTASYVLVAVLGAPVLVEFGFPILSVHLFIYYYAILANITPPVASAALVASRISGSNYYKTSIQAVILGLPGFILPFIFIYHPELLLQGGNWLEIIKIILSSTLGMISMAIFFEGWLFRATTKIERLLFGISTILLVYPEGFTDIIGYVLLAGLAFYQYKTKDKIKLVTNKI